MGQPIVQFGTSRFLLAHAALFVSQAHSRGPAGQALGGICVVQTTHNADSALRVAALAAGQGYPVHIRGRQGGAAVDEVLSGHAVREALQAHTDWPRLLQVVAHDAQVIVSNTADRGYQLDARTAPRCWTPPRKCRTVSRPSCWCCCTTAGRATRQRRCRSSRAS